MSDQDRIGYRSYSGTNSQGNDWSTRRYNDGGNSYRYENNSGSSYDKHRDRGATYDSGRGYGWYQPPEPKTESSESSVQGEQSSYNKGDWALPYLGSVKQEHSDGGSGRPVSGPTYQQGYGGDARGQGDHRSGYGLQTLQSSFGQSQCSSGIATPYLSTRGGQESRDETLSGYCGSGGNDTRYHQEPDNRFKDEREEYYSRDSNENSGNRFNRYN